MSKRVLLMLLAVFALVWAGCGGDDNGNGDDGGNGGGGETVDTVKIAAPIELTGVVAGYGVPYLDAFQQAVDVINEQGGIESLGGAQLEVMVQDSESDPQLAIQQLREMDREGPVVAVGPFGSANAVAVKPVLTSLDMPYITPALEETITDGDHGKNMWRITSRTVGFADTTMDFIEQAIDNGDIEVERMAFPHVSHPPGPSLAEAVQARAEEMGIEFRAFEYNPEETRDYAALVARIREFDPQLVSGLNYPADAIPLSEAMTRQNWRPSEGFVMIAGAYYLNAFREALGANTQGWIDASYGSAVDTQCDMANQMNETYKANSGGLPLTGLDTAAGSIVAVIADALERAGSTDREAFREALAETDIGFCDSTYLFAGNVEFDEKGDNIGYQPTLVQHEGEINQVGVFPEPVAARPAEWPAHDQAQGGN